MLLGPRCEFDSASQNGDSQLLSLYISWVLYISCHTVHSFTDRYIAE